MAAIHVTDADFNEKVLKSELPVLVDFWAQWCGPCQMAGPVLESLSEEFAGKVLIAKVDVDANEKYPSEYGVMSIPTVILIKNGEAIDRQVGFRGKEAFVELINKGL